MKKINHLRVFQKSSILILMTLLVFFNSSCDNTSNNKKAENEIVLGAVLPLTGNAGTLGDYTLKGLQLAVDEKNEAGGLLGKKIRLDIQDSKADPKEGVSIIKNMFSSNSKPFMVYSIVSGVTQAIKPITEKNSTILMSAVGTDRFFENSKYTFRNYVAATTTGREVSKYVSNENLNSLVLFYSNNEYGVSIRDAIVSECAKKSIEVTVIPYEETSLDYRSLIAAKVNDDTKCIYVAGVGKGLGTVIKQCRESGYKGKILGDQLITFKDVVTTAGNALDNMPYLDFAFDVGSEKKKTVTFVENFRKKYSTNPENFSVITYDGINLLFSVIEEEETFDSNILTEKLNQVSNFNGVFGPVSVENRNINFSFEFKKWIGKK